MIICDYGSELFSSVNGSLYCKVCEMPINAAKRFTITQHMKSAKHQRVLDSNEHIPSPSHLREGPSATNSVNSFSLD